MGGNLIGCMCLKELSRWRNVDIITVVGRYNDYGTVIDSKAWNASLLRVAMRKQLSFLQPKSVNDGKFFNELNDFDIPDFILAVQFDQILGTDLLNYPRTGCVNIHFSILPSPNECIPIPWDLIDEKPICVMMYWMSEHQDTYDVIAAKEIQSTSEDTALSLYLKSCYAAFKLFKQYFPLVLENKAPKITQSQNGQNNDNLPNPIINWKWEAQKIDRMVRAFTFPSFPGAKTYYRDLEVEILNPIDVLANGSNGHNPGQIVDITPSGLVVQTNNECILISRIRINESLEMNAAKFSQQFNVAVGDVFQSKK